MKRLFLGAGAALIGLLSVAAPASASPQDFYFSNFEADYYVSVDSDNRSALKTVEVLTAVFPDVDQNHGIERAIPERYDGHSTHVSIDSVTDANGTSLPYTTYGSEGNLVVRIGDKNQYVHGTQTYKLTYTQHDVTKYFADTNDDEFYWDTNGPLWPQRFDKVTARVHVADSLKQYITTNRSCIFGYSGDKNTCIISEPAAGEFVASTPRALNAYENMTIAIGFKPHTFAAYTPSLWEQLVALWWLAQTGLVIIAVGLSIWLVIRFNLVNERGGSSGPIPVEYTPPKDVSVTTAAQFIQLPRSVMAAQLVDLAVRHYLRIYEVKEKSWFRPAEYEIEIIKNPANLLWEEKELLSDSFGSLPKVADRLNLKTLKNNTTFYSRTLNNDKDLTKLIRTTYGLREKVEEESRKFKKVGTRLLVASILFLSPVLLLPTVIAYSCMAVLYPLTDKGRSLKTYLLGFKEYIGLAEKERLAALQSPEGVEKVGVSVGADVQKRLELYERTLPYAMLFGQEKQWHKEIGTYYEQTGTQPGWYSGHSGVFHAAAFSTAMNSFTSATSYASSSSSSSGGSSGGGSSGGGGGGGGGGGW